MGSGNSFARRCLPALLILALLSSAAMAQIIPGDRPGTSRPLGPIGDRLSPANEQAQSTQTGLRLADRIPTPQRPFRPTLIAGPNQHPLEPTLKWAKGELKNLERIQSYSAVMVKRERVGGKVGKYQYIYLRIRHRPFSVYLRFLGPASLKGREVIYVEGQNDGKMLAHGTGIEKFIGTLALRPDSRLAMKGQRYPLTDIGVLNLITRLVEVGEKDVRKGECEVQIFEGAEINNRKCTCIQVVHPVPRRDFLFHLARIFVDEELNVPVRYEAYSWPSKPGGPPELLEEYTYLNLEMNNGLKDIHFDVRNPDYKFN